MPPRDAPRLADLPHRAREFLAAARERWAAPRATPDPAERSATRAAALRWGIALFAILAIVFLIQLGLGQLRSAADAGTLDPVQQALLYTVCTNPDCAQSATIQRPLDFAAWPATCPHCQQPTLFRATPCPRCRAWMPVNGPHAGQCPACTRAAAAKAAKAAQESRPKSDNPDDEEDPW